MLSAVLVGAAVWLSLGGRPQGRRRVGALATPSGGPPGAAQDSADVPRTGARALALDPRLAGLAGGGAGLLAGGPAAALLMGGAAATTAWWWRRRARQLTAAAVRRALPDVCRVMAAELRAAATPAQALSAGALVAPPPLRGHLRHCASAAGLGVDVASLLPVPLEGGDGLVAVALCWRLSQDTGAGLATALDRIGGGLAARERCRREVAAELAGPRATAAVLAVLPLAGIGLAASLGAAPVHFLLRTRFGVRCLVIGVALDLLGVFWTSRLARSAHR